MKRNADPVLPSTFEDLVRIIARQEAERILAAREAPPELVTVAAYARARSISESTVRKAIRAGRLPAVRVGGAVRIKPTDEITRTQRPANDIIAAARAYGVGSRR